MTIVIGSTQMDVWYPVDILQDGDEITLEQYPTGEVTMKVSEFERLIEIYQEFKTN